MTKDARFCAICSGLACSEITIKFFVNASLNPLILQYPLLAQSDKAFSDDLNFWVNEVKIFTNALIESQAAEIFIKEFYLQEIRV